MEDENTSIKEMEDLRKILIRKLTPLKKKRFSAKAIDQLNLIFRVFLMKYFSLSYEFTYDELSVELEKRRIRKELKEQIMQFASLISQIEYEGRKITGAEFRSNVESMISLINNAIQSKEEKIKNNVLSDKKPSLINILIEKFSRKIKKNYKD